MELERGRVTRQIDGNAVLGVNGESTGPEAAHPLHMHLLWCQSNIVVAGYFNDGLPNIVFRTRGVCRLCRFRLDRIFKLIVREKWRDQFVTHQHCERENGKAED